MQFWSCIPKLHKKRISMEQKYIKRTIEDVIIEASKYFSVISITGPRQSGKSTLLKHLFPNCNIFSMKDIHIREYAQDDPVSFLNQTEEMIYIDEVQKVPKLLEYIQGIVDNHPERKFLLTGSSNFEILKDLSESLAGRAGVFELFPMTYTETRFEQEMKNDDQFLFDGLYPAVCSGKNKAEFFYPSYVKTYLEKDVRDLLQIKNHMLFVKFLKLCAGRIGSLFNSNELANELGVDSKTISNWLSVLQASYLIFLMPPYYENISKRLIKTPKLYFTDPGVACYLLEIESPQQLARDKMRGAIFENYVVTEVMKHRANLGKEGGVFFYRDSNQNEVDILLKQEGLITAIEVKSSMTYNKSFEKSLKKIGDWIKTPIDKKVIVYTGDYENTESDISIINYRKLESVL